MHSFLLAMALASSLAQPAEPPAPAAGRAQMAGPAIDIGPQMGHVGTDRARIWARAAGPGPLRLWLLDADADAPRSVDAAADLERDCCVVFDVADLRSARVYRFALGEHAPPRDDPAGWPHSFRTAPDPASPARVSLAFGSCCKDKPGEPLPIFDTIASHAPDALVLIGDTPYIDSTDLAVQRRRYREFLSNPQLAALRASTATYATWDDHDFGRNDTDGRLKGRENARRAFVEYHANAGADGRGESSEGGENGEGIYSKFRLGPVEVFLIDARWFSRTETSPVDPQKLTLLGAMQWEWLKRELRASTATFKVLATGMIWNESVRPLKTDYWGAYPHERAAVWKFIADEQIDGVVLMGGDIHRSRLLRHAPEFTGAPYPLYEFISSPLSHNVHANANVPHPSLVWDVGDPSVFLLLEADSTGSPAMLTGCWINAAGEELHRVAVRADEIRCPIR
ncbi:MAG: alkaline phosphatase D family protein [Phycisphaeraceae bacterium]|nr:alkaline phosphatase D family protein [Phycisphaeraceae bacterium]